MKKIVSLITIFMVMIVSATCVQAFTVMEFSLSATADKTQIKPGESVTISLKVSDIHLGENGMNTLEGILEFDKQIFEPIKEESAIGQNNWSASINAVESNENYGKFLFNKTSAGVTTEQVIGSITLKVKENVSENTPTVITIRNIASNDGNNLISVENKIINLNVQAEKENPDSDGNNVNTNTDAVSNNVGSLNIISNQLEGNQVGNKLVNQLGNKIDNTISKDKIPQTGENIIIGTSILVVGALAIYFYIRAYKMR